MLQKVFASLAIVCVLASAASAAITTTATLSRNPTADPAVNFATDTGLNSAPNNGWVSYILSVTTDTGVITGIDATITGNILQRWNITEGDEGPVITPTPNITGTTNGDSHLLASANALVGVAFAENNNINNGVQAFPADTDTRDYGVGSSLLGAWGIPAAEQVASMNFAYLVVPKSAWAAGKITGLDLAVQIGLPGGGVETLTEDSFNFANPGGGPPVGVLPTVADLLHSTTTLGEVVNLTPTDTAPGTPPVTFSALSGPTYTPGFGAPNNAPGLGTATFSWNPATQAFQFNTLGATRGTYVWTGTASNTAGSDPFSLTVNVTQVPEPATFAMVGLALVGFVGVARRRS
jgi:hypothetical protein